MGKGRGGGIGASVYSAKAQIMRHRIRCFRAYFVSGDDRTFHSE